MFHPSAVINTRVTLGTCDILERQDPRLTCLYCAMMKMLDRQENAMKRTSTKGTNDSVPHWGVNIGMFVFRSSSFTESLYRQDEKNILFRNDAHCTPGNISHYVCDVFLGTPHVTSPCRLRARQRGMLHDLHCLRQPIRRRHRFTVYCGCLDRYGCPQVREVPCKVYSEC